MWDERYSNYPDYLFGTEPNDFLREQVSKLKVGSTLSLGEGEGRNAVFLAEKQHKVTGIDMSEVGLEKAQKLADEKGVELELVCQDLLHYDFGKEKWDNIIAVFCHMPPPVRDTVWAAAYRSLKPGGHILMEVYTPKQHEYKTGGPSDITFMYTEELLKSMFPEMQFETLQETVRDIREGEAHQGMSATVQMLGKKP